MASIAELTDEWSFLVGQLGMVVTDRGPAG